MQFQARVLSPAGQEVLPIVAGEMDSDFSPTGIQSSSGYFTIPLGHGAPIRAGMRISLALDNSQSIDVLVIKVTWPERIVSFQSTA
jgi:hypothetical protein